MKCSKEVKAWDWQNRQISYPFAPEREGLGAMGYF